MTPGIPFSSPPCLFPTTLPRKSQPMSTDTWEVSNSEISTYRQCRRKWWLAYVMRLATKRSSVVGPLPLGSRIHKALELYYTDEKDLLEAHRDLVEEDRIGLLLDGYDTSRAG